MKKKSLLELRTKGFHELKEGKIHLRCPICGRKQSNMPREETDPPKAILAEIVCDRCCQGDKEPSIDYYDKQGHYVYPIEYYV